MVSSPKAPNPYQQASADQQAQTSAAGASAIMNNPNEVSPYGSVNYQISGWEQVPGADGKMQNVPRYTRTTSLSPDEQRISGYDTATRYNLGRTATQQSAKIGDYLNQSINPSGWQQWGLGAKPGEVRQDAGPTDRAAIEKAMGESYHRQTDPQNAAAQASWPIAGFLRAARATAPISRASETPPPRRRGRAIWLPATNRAPLRTPTIRLASCATRWAPTTPIAATSYARRRARKPSRSGISRSTRSWPCWAARRSTCPISRPFSRQGIGAASPGSYMASNYQNQVASANATNQGIFNLLGSFAGAGGSMMGRGGLPK